MENCLICKAPSKFIASAANDNEAASTTINVPSLELLARPASVRRLAIVYRAKNIPRRKILNFVAEHLYLYAGVLRYQGRNVSFDDEVDTVFNTDRDPSERWLGDFLSFAVEAPRQRAQRRVLDRLMMLWVALAIHNPEQAALVIK